MHAFRADDLLSGKFASPIAAAGAAGRLFTHDYAKFWPIVLTKLKIL